MMNLLIISYLLMFTSLVDSYSFPNLKNFFGFKPNNSLITLSPAGLQGFYTLGVSSFIKENYNLEPFVFSGASAGSWNALYMTYKGESDDIPNKIKNITKTNSINKLEKNIKKIFLELYNDEDFDLKKLYIGVTTFEKFRFKTRIYNDFDSLEDALDCCIASSHIPLITGGLILKYKNRISFDGGFKKYPYLAVEEPTIHVNPEMWKKKNGYVLEKDEKFNLISFFSNVLFFQKLDYQMLYDMGYNDAKKNQDILDTFLKRLE
jgi:hypothetical protein